MYMKTISAEEKVARYYWYILNKIKETLLIEKNKNKSISYALVLYPQPNNWDKPNSLVEQRLLEKLINLRVIKETDERADFQIGKEGETDNPKSAGTTYYLKINEALFDKQYNYYKKLVEQYGRADNNGNTLIFYEDGEIVYIDPTGKEYQTKLKTKTNSYSLLKFLVHNPHRVFEFGKLAESLKKIRSQVDSSDDERRVRDTIQSIKEKLKYQGDDLFNSDHGFGLNCDVLIKK